MKTIKTMKPSFPAVRFDFPVNIKPGIRWQVLCGDSCHWRAGIYSPQETSMKKIKELEKHDCPELFLLLRGRLVIVIADENGLRECELEKEKPVLVTSFHSGFCPDGSHSGTAFVIERDEFETEYRNIEDFHAT
jgi:hypothetical protein